MLPFKVNLTAGKPVYEQIVYAVHKAILSGELESGDRFPSVRLLSKELGVNPNTAHKVVQYLINESLLETIPGIGTRIAPITELPSQFKKKFLEETVEEFVVEAKRLQISKSELDEAIKNKWEKYE